MINFVEIISVFLVLFSIIDVIGSIPIFLQLRSRGKVIKAGKAAIYSFITLIIFLFIGEWILKLFKVDVSSFAVAGGIVILIMSFEMVFDVKIFKYDAENLGPVDSTTLFPVVFPLITGPGTLTTLISMRSQYHIVNIIIAVAMNMLVVFLVLRYLDGVAKLFGKAGSFILRKFFGVILLAISIRLITSNMSALIATVTQ